MACGAALHPVWEFRATLKVVEGVKTRKATERVITQLQRISTDSKAVGVALRKLSKQPRVTQIQVFQRLLDLDDCELALPVYHSLRKQHWFRWCPTFHARLAALLTDNDQLDLETPENLSVGQELELQVCLLLSYGKQGHLGKALAIFHGLQSQSSSRARNVAYKALLQAYAHLDQPQKAYLVLQQMKTAGCVPSLDDYKAVLYKFGSGGHFTEMESLMYELHQDGLQLDLSGFNMKLSVYAQAMKSDSVTEILETMRLLSIPCSVNSYNAITKSCPVLAITLESLENLPLSEASLFDCFDARGISNEELQLLRLLVKLGIPSSSVKWEENVWELDLHCMFLGTAFLVVLLWCLQLKVQLEAGKKFPHSVNIVTGWGKHSRYSRKPSILQSILQVLDRLQSPFTVDKQNRGLLSCRGSSVKLWLCKLGGTNVFPGN